jgi:hypothetical protein
VKAKTAPKEIPSPTIAQHAAGRGARKARLGLRPNGFWGMPGHSDWDSAALTFADIFLFLSTSACLNPSSWLAAGDHSGGHMPHFIRVLANRASSKTHFALRARFIKLAGLHPYSVLRPWYPGRNHTVGILLPGLEESSLIRKAREKNTLKEISFLCQPLSVREISFGVCPRSIQADSHMSCVMDTSADIDRHRQLHKTSAMLLSGISNPASGLRPNGVSRQPGHSDWASAALTFLGFPIGGLRQFASTHLHGTLRAWASGA